MSEELRNQRICGKLVDREVICHQTMVVDHLTKTDYELEWDTPEDADEIYEWWLVTRYLATKLSGHQEVIVSDGLYYWWGRQCTGQAILFDNVIEDIAREMEILAGQRNEWST